MVLFDKPTRGTSMDEFKEMLLNFLKVSTEGPSGILRAWAATCDPARLNVPFLPLKWEPTLSHQLVGTGQGSLPYTGEQGPG